MVTKQSIPSANQVQTLLNTVSVDEFRDTEEESRAAYRHALSLNLRRYKQAHDLTYGDIAKITGKGKRTVARWFSGEAMPDAFILSNLAAYFGTTVPSLFRSVVSDWSKFGGSTFEACRLAYAEDKLLEPATGVLFDYLVIGLWIPDDIARSFQNAMRRHTFGTTRLLIDGGVMFADGVKVGSLHKSSGAGWDGCTKFMFHFRGTFFRPRDQGGAAFGIRDAKRFVDQTLTDLVEMARTRAGEQAKHKHITPYDAPDQMYIKYINQLNDIDSMSDEELRQWSRAYRRNLYNMKDIRAEIFDRGAPIHWSDLTDWPVRMTVVPRVDCAVEVKVDPKIDLMEFRSWDLVDGWEWRDTMTSAEGTTLYASQSKFPLKYRDRKPMMAVYRKNDRKDIVRVEIRHPNVTYHRPEKEFGIIPCAEDMAMIFSAFLPWEVGVDYKSQHYGEKDKLAVPLTDIGPVVCVENTELGQVAPRPYSGHAAKERLRGIKQGMTCFQKNMKNSMQALFLSLKGEWPLNGEDATIAVDGNNIFLLDENNTLRYGEMVFDVSADVLQAAFSEKESKPLTYDSEGELTEASPRPLTIDEMKNLGVPDVNQLHDMMDTCYAALRLFHPQSEKWAPRRVMFDDSNEQLVEQFLEVPHRPDSVSGYLPAFFVDSRGRVGADMNDPARLTLVAMDEDEPIPMTSVRFPNDDQ